MTIRSRLIGLSGVLFLLGLTAPGTANAATCADYANQAAAQRAADTRDGDGDGIYCEALSEAGRRLSATYTQAITAATPQATRTGD